MESEGQKSSSNPSAMLTSLISKRSKLQEDLRNIERQVYELETSYLQDPTQCGTVFKGFEGFLSSSKSTTLLKRFRKFQPEDRLFSLSSVTSPAGEETAGSREDHGIGRPRGSGVLTNGQGKPRRGRGGGPREARRPRQTSEVDLDYEDDTDMF